MISAIVALARARLRHWHLHSGQIGTTSGAVLPEVTFGP
jgi:hypothetical protein